MKYESTAVWRDLTDGHLYAIGDAFPHDGREISEERYAELASSQNKAGFAVIKPVEKSVKGKPVQKEEPPKKAAKGRKKAD